jgi:glycogen synthase
MCSLFIHHLDWQGLLSCAAASLKDSGLDHDKYYICNDELEHAENKEHAKPWL